MAEKAFLSTKQVAQYLGINEKMVYALVSEKGLPATKVTGKWAFPRWLVEEWMESHVVNHPHSIRPSLSEEMLILAGSHDILLERTIALFNRLYPERIAVFGNVGSKGGLRAMARGLCHVASSHLLQQDEKEYNFAYIAEQIEGELPAVVNFCRREQGFLLAKGNPKEIRGVSDLARPGIAVANRPSDTGTRLLFDRALNKAGLDGSQIQGYDLEFRSHMDVGIQVLSGQADLAPAIRPIADLLGLDFIPLRWERYDLLVYKDRYFEEGVQRFFGLLRDSEFLELARRLPGYDLSLCGKIVFPQHRN